MCTLPRLNPLATSIEFSVYKYRGGSDTKADKKPTPSSKYRISFGQGLNSGFRKLNDGTAVWSKAKRLQRSRSCVPPDSPPGYAPHSPVLPGWSGLPLGWPASTGNAVPPRPIGPTLREARSREFVSTLAVMSHAFSSMGRSHSRGYCPSRGLPNSSATLSTVGLRSGVVSREPGHHKPDGVHHRRLGLFQHQLDFTLQLLNFTQESCSA